MAKEKSFDKRVLTRFVQTDCKRQLALDLGRINKNIWFKKKRDIISPTRKVNRSTHLMDLGKKYEQRVYTHFKSLNNVVFKEDSNKDVFEMALTPILLKKTYNNLSKGSDRSITLLECKYDNPEEFFLDLFQLKNPDKIPIKYSDQRPDIFIIRDLGKSKNTENIRELLPNGQIRIIPTSELQDRLAINVIDIKNIRKNKIGKSQFTEILYYMWTLTYFLRKYDLDKLFFIKVEDNGIFPYHNDKEISKIQSHKDILKISIKLHWDDSNQIFIELINNIRELWNQTPFDIDKIPLNLQVTCGYCYYIDDCKYLLGMDGKKPPKDWSLMLIPYTSTSISQQLIDEGLHTIGDVAQKIDAIKAKDTPKPIYSELPLLSLKAKALAEDKIITPNFGDIITYFIPKYTTAAINFAVETDPANQRVYGAAFYLYISVSSKVPFAGVFDNWWRIWKNSLYKQLKTTEIQKELNNYLLREIPLEIVDSFYNYLTKLKKLLIFPKGELRKDGKTKRKRTVALYQFALINQNYDDESEAEFAKKVIRRLYYVLELTNIIENYVVVEGFNEGEFFGPSTSIFYWSKRQLNNFQEMLERTLNDIVNDRKSMIAFDSILSLFTPTDSEVKHPYQHKKLFNVQEFVETIFGFPSIISYTWHEISKKELGKSISTKYWIPHFNYMDFNNWHVFLNEQDPKVKNDKEKKLKSQLMFKVRTINSLRFKFQNEGGYFVSENSRVISDAQFKSIFLDSKFHPIAHVWYLFSKYTGAMEELDAEYIRTTYPEYSIGKLSAAKVEHLRIIEDSNGKIYCGFNLLGLSSNMKVEEGSRVYLVPNEERGMKSGNNLRKCEVTIKEMIWYPKINGYIITTEKKTSRFLQSYIGKESQDNWYLYPTAYDSWSRKLYDNNKRNGLLQRNHFGTSWLGGRLAFIWNIRSKPELFWPDSWTFNTPAIYLFAPNLLNNHIKKGKIKFLKNLSTPIVPHPDPSQLKAINSALSYTISAIQGPPGTGKSQTIAALVDEYCHRRLQNDKKIRILISSFSYAAIRVVINKIRESKDNLGNPTVSAGLQMILVRSQYKKPVEKKKGLRDVDDLMRKSTSWKWNNESRIVTPTKSLKEQLEDNFIIFANAHQLYHLPERVGSNFEFDLIIVDEASQLPADYFMSSLQFIHKYKLSVNKPPNASISKEEIKNHSEIQELFLKSDLKDQDLTKVVIVGDFNQLPPVYPVEPPKNLEKILNSLFDYYVNSLNIPSKQLEINYRSHEQIVEYTRKLGLYKNLRASKFTRNKKLDGDLKNIKKEWVKQILDPSKVVSSLIHDAKYEIGISELEAKLLSEIIIGFYDMCDIKNPDEEIGFWTEKIGVVSPHNAQGRLITRRVFDNLTSIKYRRTKLKNDELMRYLKSTIYSVEKFQGSDRNMILSSIGISDKDQLNSESEFIYNLNRFNVLTSRAKSKIILVCSDQFLSFIPKERIIMEEAAKIRRFALAYCNFHEKLKFTDKFKKNWKIHFRYKK
ncbi:MAG: hypothetical protein GF353_21300 [Candidatus Lokiarchaeota archaeon]|nr:hypothetical protein [Candidatus Lokiarchaeota archaeon]